MTTQKSINIQGKLLDLSEPKVMGIINVTPDSFYKGSRSESAQQALRQAHKMIEEGATFLDIGGYSSRPGADDIPVDEECKRVLPIIEMIRKEIPEAIISVDTFRSEVAKQSVENGAHIVNDISAGHLDDRMLGEVAKLCVPYIGMHMRGTPQTMKALTQYDNLLLEVTGYFGELMAKANQMGIKDVIIDPGFGFAKTADQNYELLNHLDQLKRLGQPILVGLSRKSMIYKILNISSEEALNGTTVLNTVALLKGVSILRVHDVREAVQTLKLVNQLTL